MTHLRLPLAAIALASCTPAAEPTTPPPVVPPAVAAIAAIAAPTASAAPAPAADEGPPPQPPMAMRFTYQLPSIAGRPWSTQRLVLAEDGGATWDAETGGGDGEVDETLTPIPARAVDPVRCRGHLGPILHRKLVEAARRAMASGCKMKAPRPEGSTTTMAVTWEGEVRSCTLERSGGSYLAFEKAREEAVAVLCKKP
jgi:hypothetical protein